MRIVKPADAHTINNPGRLTMHGTRGGRKEAAAQGALMRLTDKPGGTCGPDGRSDGTEDTRP